NSDPWDTSGGTHRNEVAEHLGLRPGGEIPMVVTEGGCGFVINTGILLPISPSLRNSPSPLPPCFELHPSSPLSMRPPWTSSRGPDLQMTTRTRLSHLHSERAGAPTTMPSTSTPMPPPPPRPPDNPTSSTLTGSPPPTNTHTNTRTLTFPPQQTPTRG
ncbi:hypothetical protein Vretifemale_10793, partial [Volvox reticuliferus]